MKTEIRIPFGPQHPDLEEPINFMFKVEEEYVKEVKVRLGYIHRGIEKLAEERTYLQNVYLVERICGICSFAHSTCYVQAAEELLGIEAPRRARFIRTITAEMERIQNHYLWLAFTAKGMGFDTLFMYSMRDRDNILKLLELITGKRVNYGLNTIGGVRRDIQEKHEPEIFSKLLLLRNRAKKYKELCNTDPLILKRTKNIGILNPDDARKLSAVGPTIRASGIDDDIRAIEKYAAYDEFSFKVITYRGCDVFSRILVRIDEILESVKIVKKAVSGMPDTPIKVKTPREIPTGEAISKVEAPRGENLHFLKSNGTERPERLKVRAPTLANLSALCKMLEGANIAYIPVIIAGIDP
jgi:membrane-bound hydrogenase subunit alpha